MKYRNFLRCAVLALLAIPQVPCLAATFNVNSNADNASPPAGTVTLRSAIAAANTAGGANVVNVPAGLGPYSLTLGALTTTNASNNILVVQGTGGSAVIDAGGLSGVFRLTGGTVTLSNLTIQNGSAPSPNPGSNGICSGGGIFIGGSTTVNVNSSVVTNNQTPNASGGGICVTGTLNLLNSTVSNNNGANGGGGIRVSIAATASIANSTVSNNRITANGAAGGGIENQGTLTVTNSTISGNLASNGDGGAVSQEGDGSTDLSNVTIAGNSSPGSAQLTSYGGTNISIASTIITDPVSGANCLAAGGGTITSHGHNLDSANSCGFASAGDVINANPLLRPLQNNGGPTSTMALLAGSPAIDAVPLASCTVITDQRGVSRPQGAACDIGAFETAIQIYSVTYTGNGSTGGSVPTDGNAYAAGATVTVLGNTGNLAKTGYTFAGWNTAANGSGTAYAGGAIFAMGSAHITLYAQWTQSIAQPMPLPTGPTSILGGDAACFQLQQPPGSPPVVSNNALSARPLGELTSGNTYSWLFELGAFAGPVDSYLVLQLPNTVILFLEEQPTLQWSPTAVTLVPSTSGPITFNPLFNVPYSVLAGTGTYVGHVFVVPAGTNPATFSFATSPYYHWCFQRTF